MRATCDLKQSDFKAAPWIFDIWNCAVCVEVSRRLGWPQSFRETRKSIETYESRALM